MASVATSSNIWPSEIYARVPPEENPITQECMFDFVIDFWTNRATPEEIESANRCPEHALVSFIVKAVVVFWLALVELVTAIVSSNEYYMFEFEEISFSNSTDRIKAELANLRKALGAVSRARRRINWNLAHMSSNLETLGHPLEASGLLRPTVETVDMAGLEEFSIVFNRLLFEKNRIESLIPVVIGACTILEAQGGAMESRHVNALTSLAALFVPISVVAGILSMGDRYLPGQADFWVFWAIAVPLTILVTIVVYNLSFVSRAISMVKLRIGWPKRGRSR